MIDYIFYRLYIMYKKHGDPPILSTCIFLSYIVGIAIVILFFCIQKWADIHNLIAPLFIFVTFCVMVYRKKKIEGLMKKYQGCVRNKLIANWMIWCIPIYEMILGVLIYHFLIN